jgi:YD repeat-containing protein
VNPLLLVLLTTLLAHAPASAAPGVRSVIPPEGATVTETVNARGLVGVRTRGTETHTYTYDGSRPEGDALFHGTLRAFSESIVDDLGRTVSTFENTGFETYTSATVWNGRTGTQTANWQQGQTATVELDGMGRMHKRTLLGVDEVSVVDAGGALLSSKAPHEFLKAYNYITNQPVLENWSGRETTMAYDTAGRLTTVTDPLNHTVSTTYDALNIPTQRSITSFVDEQHTFDSGGAIASKTIGSSVHKYTHGPVGELLSVDQAGVGTYTYAYKPDGLLAQMNPPGGVAETYNYDAERRLSKRTRGPSAWATTYEGNVATTSTPLGHLIITTTDSRGRAVNTAYSGSDGLISDERTYTVDDQPLVVAQRNTLPADHVDTTTYAYDARLRVMSRNASAYSCNVNNVGLTYTKNGVPYAMNGFGEQTQAGPVSLSYTNAGLLSGRSAPGMNEVFTYNNKNLVENINVGGTNVAYTYDNRGNRLTESVGGVTKSFGFDAADRLVEADNTTFGLRGDGARSNLAYNESGGLSGTVTTDASGRVTQQNGITYQWDVANRLVKAGADTYSYDDNNLRIGSTGNAAHSWQWGAMGLEKIDGADVFVADNVVLGVGSTMAWGRCRRTRRLARARQTALGIQATGATQTALCTCNSAGWTQAPAGL